MSFRLFALPLVLTAACDTADTADTADTTTDTADTLAEGDWIAAAIDVTDRGTCGSLADLFPAGSIGGREALTRTGDGTFSLTFYAVEGVEQCALDATDDTFTCDGFTASQRWDEALNVDVVFAALATSTGELTPGALTRRTQVDITCTGADCDATATQIDAALPCTMEVRTVLTAP